MGCKKVIGLVMAVLVVVVFCQYSYGASAAKTGVKQVGYCCAGGKVFSATKEACEKQKGTYYDSKLKADAACKPQKGYCCVKGKVVSATEASCAKQKGAYYGSKLAADKACKLALVKGYCCVDGKVMSATKAECTKQKGAYYDSILKADKACKAAKGYCCVKGTVIAATAMDCTIKKGRFFRSKKEAEKACAATETATGGVYKDRGRPDDGGDTPAEPVRVTVTEAGSTIRPGSTITVRYTIVEPLPPSVRISLRHHVGGAVTDTRSLHEGAPDTDRDVRLLLPADVTGSDYRIQVTTVGETTSRSGESTGFDILGLASTRDELNLSFISRPGWYMTPIAGEGCSLDFAISCDGGGCEGQAFQLGLMVDGSLVETRTLSAVEAVSGQMHWESNCGGTWELVIDPDDLLAETDETDNTASGTVECIVRPDTEKPDLLIYSAHVHPWPLVAGTRVDFNYSLFNTGRFGEVATGPFSVGLRVGDRIILSNRHAAGMPYTTDHSEMVEGTITWWFPTCGEPIALVVDTEDEVDEADETNNVYDGSGGVAPFECVPASLDLTVMLFQVSDDNPEIAAGATKTYIADIIALRGDPRSVRVRCGIVGGAVLHEEVLPSIDVMAIDPTRRGERIRFDTSLCPAGSTFRLYCEVDPDGAITEYDETNNRQEYEVTTVVHPSYHCP